MTSPEAAPSPAPAVPSTGDTSDRPLNGAPGRGSVVIAGLLIPTQQKAEPSRGVETPGQEQPLLSEDEEQEDKCARPCQAAINEVCRQMSGEHRCLCRPGFSRARDSDACEREDKLEYSMARYRSLLSYPHAIPHPPTSYVIRA